jgi:hypothetical protein
MGALIVLTRTIVEPRRNIPPVHGLITLAHFLSSMVTQPNSALTDLDYVQNKMKVGKLQLNTHETFQKQRNTIILDFY